MSWPHEDVASLNAFYGDPRGPNGKENPTWAAKNLVSWAPPYPMFYSDGQRTPLRHLRFHKKCVEAFDAAFKDVLATLGQAYISAHRLDISGGSYCYRVERGGSRLSVHSWGAAIDMDPNHNPFPAKWTGGQMIDIKFADILRKHGLCWRGQNGDVDAMHFQAVAR
jgi:hypothetical protein